MFSHRNCWSAALFTLIAIAAAGVGAGVALAEEEAAPVVVLQRAEMKGAYIRVAYNAEAWVVLGFQTANYSLGEDWMLLEVGMTLLKGQKNQNCTRDKLSLLTPNGDIVPLATQVEFGAAGHLKALNKRGDMQRDNINYFPPGTSTGCRIGFFADPTESSLKPFDQFELAHGRGCLGRLFFKIPGSIQYGQYWLIVEFDNSHLKVPFKVLTEKDAKANFKTWSAEQKKAKKKS